MATPPLPVDGNYVVVVNPKAGSTGTATVQLFAVVDETGTITPSGSAVPIALTTPGQKTLLTFSGANGQRVSANIALTSGNLGGMLNCYWVRILKPDSTPLGTDRNACANTTFFEPWTLQTTGTHTFVVDPQMYYTGEASVNLYDVPPDVTGTLSVNGDPVPVSLTAPGQNAYLTFAGTQGQTVTMRLTGNTITGGGGYAAVSLLRPNGTSQTTAGSLASSFNSTPQTLATTGTYTVRVDPTLSATGDISVQVTSP